jgi:hypothetical protein
VPTLHKPAIPSGCASRHQSGDHSGRSRRSLAFLAPGQHKDVLETGRGNRTQPLALQMGFDFAGILHLERDTHETRSIAPQVLAERRVVNRRHRNELGLADQRESFIALQPRQRPRVEKGLRGEHVQVELLGPIPRVVVFKHMSEMNQIAEFDHRRYLLLKAAPAVV